MAVIRACLCTREDAQTALDLFESQRNRTQIDRAIQSASDSVEQRLHRSFVPIDTTYFFPWPNFQYAYPWRVWFDNKDLATTLGVSVTSGGIPIPITVTSGTTTTTQVFFEPVNSTFGPFNHMELNRSTNAAFGLGPTPQRSIAVTGTWAYQAVTVAAGTITAALTTTTAASVLISNASAIGVGDQVIIDTERMIVTDRSFAATTTVFTGPITASTTDNIVPVVDGTQFNIGETILLDAERMLITDISGNNLIVRRAWDGTTLTAHTSGTIYCNRTLIVQRGAQGTTAATHLINAPILKFIVPGLVRDLTIAEATVMVLQETSGYARQVGESANAQPISGPGLEDLRARCLAQFGRKARVRVI